jgi:hypothetical protein
MEIAQEKRKKAKKKRKIGEEYIINFIQCVQVTEFIES